MELHQIRYFLTVCETRNVTRAAELCNVAQPSLTRAIQRLEDELGGALFVRGRAGAALTELGERMRPYLEQSYMALQMVEEEAASYAKLERAALRLGVMCTIGPARLVGLIDRLHQRVASPELVLHEAAARELVQRMVDGGLDVALIGLPRLPDALHAVPLYRERYVVACPPGHRFAAMPAVPLGELAGEPYLQRLNCEFMDHFAELGVPDPIRGLGMCFASQWEEWIQALILAGMGCAVMPEYLPLFPALTTRVLVEPEVEREVKLVTVAGRRFAPAVEAFVRLARAYDWNAGR